MPRSRETPLAGGRRDVPGSPAGRGVAPSAVAAQRTSRPPVRRAVAVDPAKKAEVERRLKRIEGQVRGLQRMVQEERYCADVLDQVASVQRALSGAGRVLLRNHLEHCVAGAVLSGDPGRADTAYDEVIGLVYRYTDA